MTKTKQKKQKLGFEKENMEFTWNLNLLGILKEKTFFCLKDSADFERAQIINFPFESLRLICLLRKYIVFSRISDRLY